MGACQWRYALGKPYEGVHASRMCGLATVDVLGTLGLGVAAALALRSRVSFRVSILPCILGIFLLGIFLHWWFCVPTALNVWLGLVSDGFRDHDGPHMYVGVATPQPVF